MTPTGKESLAVTGMVCGLILFFSTLVYPGFYQSKSGWTNEMAARFQQASVNYHDAIGARVHSRAGAESRRNESFDQARDEYQRLENALNSSKARGNSILHFSRWGGVFIFLCGVFFYAWQRLQGSERDSYLPQSQGGKNSP